MNYEQEERFEKLDKTIFKNYRLTMAIGVAICAGLIVHALFPVPSLWSLPMLSSLGKDFIFPKAQNVGARKTPVSISSGANQSMDGKTCHSTTAVRFPSPEKDRALGRSPWPTSRQGRRGGS